MKYLVRNNDISTPKGKMIEWDINMQEIGYIEYT